jgi:hypothetical protein
MLAARQHGTQRCVAPAAQGAQRACRHHTQEQQRTAAAIVSPQTHRLLRHRACSVTTMRALIALKWVLTRTRLPAAALQEPRGCMAAPAADEDRMQEQ